MSNKGLEPLHSVRKTDTLPVKLIAIYKKKNIFLLKNQKIRLSLLS